MVMIALFGTSADPPTAGHQAILEWLSYHFDQVAVWAADNPFKTHRTALQHREVMLRLLIDGIDSPRRNVALYPELSHSKTLTTVEQAQQRWSKGNLTLVIGSDLISKIFQWYRIDELLAQVYLLVIPRPGYPLAEPDLDQLKQRSKGVGIADLTGPAVSSTAYREQGNPEELPPPIATYIHQEGLYAHA